MRKLIIGAALLSAFPAAALAGHNPTPPEGYKNYGQCRSELAQEQNEVRKNPEDYTAAQAEDIMTATCEEGMDGSFRIIFT